MMNIKKAIINLPQPNHNYHNHDNNTNIDDYKIMSATIIIYW